MILKKFSKLNFSYSYFLPILLFLIYLPIIFLDFDVLGRNWDWSFPSERYQYLNLIKSVYYSWNLNEFGQALDLQAHIPINLLVGIFGFLIGGKYLSIFFLLSVHIISFFSSRFLLKIIYESKIFTIPCIFYAFSPYLFSEIIGGSYVQLYSYAFAPYLIAYVYAFLKDGKFQNLLISLLAGIMVIISLQKTLTAIIIIFLLSLYLLIAKKVCIYKLCKRYLLLILFFLFSHLYWLIPFISHFNNLWSEFSSSSFSSGFQNYFFTKHHLLSIFGLYAYSDRNHYENNLFIPIIFYIEIIFYYLISIFLFYRIKFPNKFLISALLSIIFIFALFATFPLNKLYLFLSEYLTLLSIYRTSQHLMFYGVFGVLLILSFSSIYFKKYILLNKFNFFNFLRFEKLIVFFFVFSYLHGWFYPKPLGTEFLAAKKMDNIALYSNPDYLKEFFNYDKEKGNFKKTYLFIPPVFSPGFYETGIMTHQGMISEYNYLNGTFFSAEKTDIGSSFEDIFCYGDVYKHLPMYIKKFNISDIIVRDDITPHHSFCGRSRIWDFLKFYKLDSVIPGISKVNDNHFIVNNYESHFVKFPTNIISSDCKKLDCFKYVNHEVSTINNDNLSGKKIIKPILSDFDIISPVNINIKLTLPINSLGFIPIVLNQTYHDDWKIKGFDDSNHILADGYYNMWMIDKELYCIKTSLCHINDYGNQVVSLEIRNTNHIITLISLLLSFSFLIILIIIYKFKYVKNI